LGLYYPADAELITRGYADVGYFLDPADAKSKTGCVFLDKAHCIFLEEFEAVTNNDILQPL
jgi:hypothetical protein